MTVSGAPLLLEWGEVNTQSADQQRASRTLRSSARIQSVQRPTARGTIPWLVQFNDVVREEWKDALESAGAELKGYIPENAFLIEATPKVIARIGDLPEVVWVGEYLPAYKRAAPVRMLMKNGGEETREYNLILFSPDALPMISSDLKSRAGVTVSVEEAMGGRALIRCRLPLDVVEDVCGWSEVEWVEPYLQPQLWNDSAVRTNKMNVSKVWATLGLSGAGQTIAVCDTGLDTGNPATLHPDFTNRVTGFGWTNGAYSTNATWNDTYGHGTHVAGSVLGNGTLSSGQYKGVAYEADLLVQGVGSSLGGIPPNLNGLFKQAFDNGARIHSDSWGYKDYGTYSWDSRNLDMFVWSNKTMLVLVAAGNEGVDTDSDGVIDHGSVGSPGTAKNCLTIGASETYRTSGGYSSMAWGTGSWAAKYPVDPINSDLISQPDTPQGMAAFSGRGPCQDGRIKPDLIAPGTDIISTRSRNSLNTGWGTVPGNTNYVFWGGTSMSTPLAAGAAGLARQWVMTSGGITNPSAALLKALLINGARNMAPGQYGTGAAQEISDVRPNAVQGWGHVDLFNTLQPATNQFLDLYDTHSLSTGETNTYTVTVNSTTTNPFILTLAYSDYWAAPGAGKKLVNDLDLTVTSPTGNVIYANGLDCLDATNNVEMIEFAPVETGTYTIRVAGRSVPSGGSQDYALVVRGEEPGPEPSAPVFDVISGQIATSGMAMAFTMSATGTPSPVLALQSTTVSSGFSFSPESGELSYLPVSSDAGLHSFVFTASNSIGVVTQTVSVLVMNVPVFEPLGSQIADPEQALLFTVAAAGAPTPTLMLQSSTASGGVAFTPETGLVSYTPPLADVGSQTFVFTASNSAGVATQMIAVTVHQVTPTVTIWPVASSLTYGQPLNASVLTGGEASVSGTFAYTTPETVPPAGVAEQSVTFLPTDLATYVTVTSGVSVTVGQADQTIEFQLFSNQWVMAQIGLSATASSGLPVSFSVTDGPGTISSGTNLLLTGTGTVSVGASQTGNANWNPAPVVSRTIQVSESIAEPVVSSTNVNVRESGEGRFFVRLSSQPASDAMVTITWSDGDEDLEVQGGGGLTFTPANWSDWQVVTLSATDDVDAVNGTASFQVALSGLTPQTLTAAELDDDIGTNMALSSNGSTISGGSRSSMLIDGLHSTISNYGYMNSVDSPPGAMTLDLKIPMNLTRMRVLNWNWSWRVHRYTVESSMDGTAWVMLADASAMDCQGWDDWEVDATARYLRFTALSNSANSLVCIPEWEVMGEPVLPQLVLAKTDVNVHENGEGRFFVKLGGAPSENTVVTVARNSGDADLSVQSGGTLTFTPANWDEWQAVTLVAADDADADNSEAIFYVSTLGVASQAVAATELDDEVGGNLALAASGSSISGGSRDSSVIDGIHDTISNYGYMNSADVPPGAMTLDLKAPIALSRMRVLNWDWTWRVHRYRIESSLDGSNWSLVADASAEAHQGWDDWPMAGQTARFLRFTGLSNSANSLVCIPEWEVYGLPEPVILHTQLNVRESGEGRLYVRLDRIPDAATTVTVTRVAGDADLTLQSGGALVFTAADWDDWQVVTMAAASDADAESGTATLEISTPGVADQTVTAVELDEDIGTNIALSSNGSTISGGSRASSAIDGIHDTISNYGYMNSADVPPGAMTLDLKAVKTVSRMRVLNWDWFWRVHRYQIESSLDGTTWTLLVDASAEEHQGWDDWPLVDASARFLRITGLSNSANSLVCIPEWEVYGTQPPAVPLINTNAVNVRENGEGRFFVKLDRVPDETLTVTASRASGDTNLSVQGGGTLTFTPANWDSWQIVTLAAADDADAANGTAAIEVQIAGVAAQIVTATELDEDIGTNMALSSNGSTISGGSRTLNAIDGIHATISNYSYLDSSDSPPESMVLDLKSTIEISRVRLLNWDWSCRVHRYTIEASEDGAVWEMLVDASAEDHQGWDEWPLVDASARFLRITGLSNSANSLVCIPEWEVFGEEPDPASCLLNPSDLDLPADSPQAAEFGDVLSWPVTVVSSTDGPEHTNGWAAVDGDTNTFWQGASGEGGYLAIAYDSTQLVSGMEICLAEDSLMPYECLYSLDAETWDPVPVDLADFPIELRYLWILFPVENSGSLIPEVAEISLLLFEIESE